MNTNQQKAANPDEQIKENASGGELVQEQVARYTQYKEVQTDTLADQIEHWQNLEERMTHCPESLTPLDCQHLRDYRDLYGNYQYRIASQLRLEKMEGK